GERGLHLGLGELGFLPHQQSHVLRQLAEELGNRALLGGSPGKLRHTASGRGYDVTVSCCSARGLRAQPPASVCLLARAPAVLHITPLAAMEPDAFRAS